MRRFSVRPPWTMPGSGLEGSSRYHIALVLSCGFHAHTASDQPDRPPRGLDVFPGQEQQR
ncbi:hypothetical protein OHB12_03595 [Nocardia sp. NBC_01730]|uniref:hypothetical protein n=1 Tax=Nocardia sp. NBC_01730 TaxID=2975998 RepID=UPI002E12AE46|nr:hypothetical protein OHB12_03595 [Nocardia sp. NBC_01730]